jgi:hypothetical protein
VTKPVLNILDMPFVPDPKWPDGKRHYNFRLRRGKWLYIEALPTEKEIEDYCIYLDTIDYTKLNHADKHLIKNWIDLTLLEAQCRVYQLVEEYGDDTIKT